MNRPDGSSRLLFDLSATQPNQAAFHGGGEYAKAVFHVLCSELHEISVSAFHDPARPLDEAIRLLCHEKGISLLPVDGCDRSVKKLLDSSNFTHCFSALPYGFGSLNVAGIKTTWVIHGLRELECANDEYEFKYVRTLRQAKSLLRKRVDRHRLRERARQQAQSLLPQPGDAQRVIVPSLHTKYSIIREYPDVDPQSINVIASPIKPLAEPASLGDASVLLGKLGLEANRFMLLTSAGRWIKNAYRAVRAFDELISVGQLVGMKLVVIGGEHLPLKRWKLGRPDRLVVRGYLNDRDLSLLYREAFAFIYPTLNEGFGYPPIESMFYGKPVIASATTAVPEVCADAALFFNPLDVSELKNRLLMLCHEPGLYSSLTKKGRERARELITAQPDGLRAILALMLR
jgi:glycosyltransferase involved in cell wall biosynthesis